MSKITPEEFAIVWNNCDKYPNVEAVSRELGLAVQTCKNRAYTLRQRYEDGEKVPRILDRSERVSLLPEEQNDFIEGMTSQECIDRLRQLYFADPGKNITRLYFRSETGIADSTWSRYFGTFLEFKRQAGLELKRDQHAMERKIAKHVSVDHYRDFNTRHDLSERYVRDSGKNIKVIIGCSDLHDEEIDPFYLRVFIESCRMIQPDVINFGGDIFDLAEFGKYGVDPREWDVVGRIRFVHENIFKPLREACPNTQFDFVEGNHEFRLLRHLADATPALKAVLSDLLGLTVPKLLGLDEFEINYISKADLGAYNKGDVKKEVSKSYKVYDERVLIHHHPHAANWGLPGWNGHHHSWHVQHKKCALHGAYQWLQLGCGHQTKASYTEGEFWSMGFNICHLNKASGTVSHEYVNVTDIACVGGVYFHRDPSEMVGFFGGKSSSICDTIKQTC